MNLLIEWLVQEIRRVLIDRIAHEFINEMTQRDFFFFILGAVSILGMLRLEDMNPPIVFFHIDKTGGTTVCDYLAQQFDHGQIRPVPCGKRVDALAQFFPTAHADLYAHNRKFKHDRAHQLIMGHYDTGILEWFDESPVTTMTVLREPVARVVSLYRYVHEHEELYGKLSVDAQTLGIDAWMRKHVGLWDNAQTRQIAGQRWSSGYKEASEAMLIRAEAMLRQIDYVGVMENLTQFLERVAEGLGWSAPELKRLNQTVRPETVVPPETRAFIEAHTIYDARLYQVAKGIGV